MISAWIVNDSVGNHVGIIRTNDADEAVRWAFQALLRMGKEWGSVVHDGRTYCTVDVLGGTFSPAFPPGAGGERRPISREPAILRGRDCAYIDAGLVSREDVPAFLRMNGLNNLTPERGGSIAGGNARYSPSEGFTLTKDKGADTRPVWFCTSIDWIPEDCRWPPRARSATSSAGSGRSSASVSTRWFGRPKTRNTTRRTRGRAC